VILDGVHPSRHAAQIADRLAADLAPTTVGVALFGSVAKGTDHPHSDIDLVCAATEHRATEIRHVEGRMVTITRATPADLAAAFTRPWDAGPAVAAWRYARLLHDPTGVLADLQQRARAWTWDDLGPAADTWAARELVGLAEEIHKIAGMLATGRPRPAAANRLIIALALAAPYAVANRLLWDSDNDLWDALADTDPAWAAAWDTASGLTAADPDGACRGALRLYRLAAAALTAHLDGHDLATVTTADRLAAAILQEPS
jgi:hypothetical protein